MTDRINSVAREKSNTVQFKSISTVPPQWRWIFSVGENIKGDDFSGMMGEGETRWQGRLHSDMKRYDLGTVFIF